MFSLLVQNMNGQIYVNVVINFFKIIGEYDKMREHRINQDSVHQEMPEFESVENWGFRVCNHQPTNQKFIAVVVLSQECQKLGKRNAGFQY